jgi:hypothetical protein
LTDKENINTWLRFENKIYVETITLHDFFIEKKIKEVDFMHMDVQGAELKALLGAKKYISKIKTIWLEVSDIEIYKDQVLRKDVEKFMNKSNFFLYKSEIENNVGDQFYVNKKYFRIITFFSKVFFFKRSVWHRN